MVRAMYLKVVAGLNRLLFQPWFRLREGRPPLSEPFVSLEVWYVRAD
jgi:hypothetical protein